MLSDLAQMTEHRAHLEQGRSQLQLYEFLAARDANEAPEAHTLHFLQMATENIAKAILLRSNPGWDKYRHAVFAAIPHHLRARHIAKTLGWTDFKAYQRFLSDVMPLCQEIEKLHPQGGSGEIERSNVEYPWLGRDRDGREIWLVPAAYEFGLLSRMRRSLGMRLINFLFVLIQRFDEVF